MTRPTRDSLAGRQYLALQKKARAEARATDEYLQLHALEAFVDRLTHSPRASHFALKGGMLLSAYAARRPTRDVDLSSHGLPNELDAISALVADIANLPCDDGWALAVTGVDSIREEEAYSGARVTVHGALASARQEFHVDVSFGDPISPSAGVVTLERLLGGAITLRGYPLSMVFAEKLITALQRGTTNTRWRDYADVYRLSRGHAIDADMLATSLRVVAEARLTSPGTLAAMTTGFASLAQSKWAAWVRKQKLTDILPLDFAELLGAVVSFVDPVFEGRAAGRTWKPQGCYWEDRRQGPRVGSR